MRGNDPTVSIDPEASSRTALNGGATGAMVGSSQSDAVRFHAHKHQLGFDANGSNERQDYVAGFEHGGSGLDNDTDTMSEGARAVSSEIVNWDETPDPFASQYETRPKNIAVNFMIRAQ